MFILRFPLLCAFFILALAACTMEPEPAGSPPSVSAKTIPAPPTRYVATAAPQKPPARADERTATPQPTETPPTPLVGFVPAERTAAPLPVKEELTFTVASQLGGIFNEIAIDGNTVYLGIGPRFTTVDISDPASPRLLWQSDVLPDVVGAIAVRPGLAFLRAGSELLIYDVGDPAQPAMIGKMSGISGELYPAGDFIYTTAAGVANPPLIVIDVSDPSQPILSGTHELSSPTQIAASERAIYLASGGYFDDSSESGLRLVDPIDLESTLSELELNGDWNHRVAISGNIAFIVEDRLFEGPDVLLVLDVSDPTQPREVASWQFDVEKTIDAIQVNAGTLFMLGRSFPHTGCPAFLYLVDITDPASPKGPVEIDPGSCFNNFALAGDTLVATGDRGLQIFYIGDSANLTLSGEMAPLAGFIAVERVAKEQDLVYLLTTAGRNRLHRLRVLDVAGSAPTLLNGDGLDLEIEPSIFEGLDIRGDRLFGLGPDAVDISKPADPRLAIDELANKDMEGVYYWPTPALVDDVLYTGWLSATPDGMMIGGGVGIVDISDAANPVLVNTVSMEGSTIMGLSANDKYLIVFGQEVFTQSEESTEFMTILQIFDLSDPLAPVEVGRLEPAVDLPEQVWDFTVAGDTVYAASVRHGDENEYKLYALDISDPLHPAEIGRYELPGNVTKMVATGDTIFMRLSDGRLWALNVSDRSHPYLSGQLWLTILDFSVDGDLLYLAAGDAGLYRVQVEQ